MVTIVAYLREMVNAYARMVETRQVGEILPGSGGQAEGGPDRAGMVAGTLGESCRREPYRCNHDRE